MFSGWVVSFTPFRRHVVNRKIGPTEPKVRFNFRKDGDAGHGGQGAG